ncbi:TOG array regulator of axonemal microtubules protein 1 [Holothuria leucospilota]|uniref:TOG array regulator of axonemal microtubules protein 1 n=1 Tax=Holothuria leucospilota TaxID=206669 RepID=A0A9Q1CIM7_HOLLE|nr:TOG array regulator of axonemal microtubules protein 1 [Holothuria leucospilota]
MRVMRKLMQTLEPKPVIDVVSESLRHKKSGVREEALHIIIAALLTFPSNDFDLPKLCDCVAPTLGDPKRKVRQASLETFAVLAQAMGPTKITPLIRAVDGIELQMNDEGVMKAVQARLARRQLPRINAEDTVELPSPLPSSASSRSASSVGFDTVWILKAAGSTGSAKDRSYTDPAIELSQPSPNKSAQNSSTFQELTPPKRFHSAGRGRSKLPWEEDRDDRPEVDEDRISDIFDGTSTGRGQLNSAPSQQKPQEIKPPFKPRQTWNSSDPNLFESSIRRQRPGFLNDKQDLWESPAGFGGSYRQQHLDKMRMMSLAPVKNDSEERPYNGSHSAPVSDRAGSDPFPLPASYLSKKRDERNMEEIWNEKRIVYDTKQKGLRRPKDLSAISKSPRRSFSNSWPDGSFGEDVQPRRNAVSNTPKRAAGHYSGSTAPIPQKATLARSASRSRSKDTSPRDEIIDIDFDDNPLRSPDSDDDLDSADFLQSVRSSAQKKRALKQAKTNKSSSSYQQSYSEPQESAFFNNFTPMNSAVEESGNTIVEASYKSSSTKKGPPDSPFSSKPRIVRSSSGRNPRRHSAELVSRNIDPAPDFNPAGGVTFRDNPNADVTIVGKGYNKSGEGARGPIIDDTLAAVMNGRQQANARERRRYHKGSVPSPGGLATVHFQGDPEYGEWISDGSGIRGHGVFGNQQNFHSDQLLTQNKKHGNRKDVVTVQHGENPPEIVGYSYQQNSPGEIGKSDDEDLEMSMSRAVMDKISQKQEKQRKARKAEKVSREMNDDIAEMRKKSLEDERQRLKERNDLVGLKDSLQRTPERGRKYERDTQPVRDLDADYQSDSETEKERLVQQKEEQFRAEVEQEKRFRLEEERRKASAEARKRLQAEEKRRQEEEEYRRLEMEERRIQAEEKQRLAEEKRIAEERRLSEEAEMKRRIQEEEDKYAAEEFEEDPSLDYGHVAMNSAPKTTQKPPPPMTSKRKKIKSPKSPGRHGLSQSMSASSVTTAQDPDTPPSSDATYDQTDELKPLANPSTALKDALRFLEQDDWEVKNDGLTIVRRLSLFHADVFGAQLHSVVIAVLAEVKNLRSNVSKCAIVCLGDMFVGLNVDLDKELDQICKVIMPKALDGSTFIRNSLDNTLMSMVQNVSPQRALAALISVGACHNSKMVRKITAQFLAEIVQRMGPGRVLSGIKDVTDKVLITTAKLSLDAYQETRYYARKIVYMLMQHEDFSRLVDRYVPPKDLKSFQEVVVTLKTKGLTEPSSSESLSAKGSRRSLSNSRANSGSNVHYRDKAYSNGSAHEDRTPPSSVKKSKRSSARSETQQESVAELVKSLTSSDWKVKIDAVETFQAMCETNPDLVNDNIMKIFDGFCPRLADSNSKVCIVALNTMKEVIPYIADGLPDAVPEVTSKLVKSLASKNNTIYQNSNEIFDLLMDHIDNTLLVQHFAVATKLANARVKPPMIEKLTRLVTTVYPKKPQLITRQILPVLWDVLGNMTSSGAVPGGSGNLRKATKELVMSLYQFMGRGLIQEASSLSQRSKTALEGLIDS